jgi:hypothetical protein
MFLDQTPESINHNYLMNQYTNNTQNLLDNASILNSLQKKNASNYLMNSSSDMLSFDYYRSIELCYSLNKNLNRSSNDNIYYNN